MRWLAQLQSGFRKAEKIEVAGAEDLSQSVRVASQSDARCPRNRDNKFRERSPEEEGDIGIRALVMAPEAACVAASNRYSAESGQRDRRRSNADVEAPETVRRLEAVEALIINLRRFSFEIRGSLKLNDETALDL